MAALVRMDRLVGRALLVASGLCMVLLLALVAFLVLNRFLAIPALGWTDEVVELLFAWLIFIGAAAVWREKGHFCVDALLQSLRSPRWRAGVGVAVSLCNLLFLAAMAWLGLDLARNAGETSPVLGLSRVWWYGVMPAMLALMCVYSVRDLWRDASLFKQGSH